MATLIPAIGTCISRMTGGEKRLASRLENKLEDDWLCWYDVPLGPRNVHPDFVVFNPRRGLLVLEVKDWKLETIQDIDRQSASILTANGLKRVANPLEQARQYAHEVSNLLQRDPQLTINSGRMQGTLLFPWGYGVVLANISRKQFDSTNLGEVLELASSIAKELLTPADSDEDGIPLIAPISAGRHGPAPLVIKLPSIQAEADYIANHLKEAHKTGTPWSDMAVIYHDYASVGKPVLATLRKCGVPVTYFSDITFAESEDTVKFLTMHSCKGLEFPLVAIPGAGQMGVEDGRKEEDARLLYVAMTRATRELVVVG